MHIWPLFGLAVHEAYSNPGFLQDWCLTPPPPPTPLDRPTSTHPSLKCNMLARLKSYLHSASISTTQPSLKSNSLAQLKVICLVPLDRPIPLFVVGTWLSLGQNLSVITYSKTPLKKNKKSYLLLCHIHIINIQLNIITYLFII